MLAENSKPLVIITGASSGIGAAVAKIFSEVGYSTALLFRNKNIMDSLQLNNLDKHANEFIVEKMIKDLKNMICFIIFFAHYLKYIMRWVVWTIMESAFQHSRYSI